MTGSVNHNLAVSTVNTKNAPAATSSKKQNIFAKVASDLANKLGIAYVSRAAQRHGVLYATRIVCTAALSVLTSLTLIACFGGTRQSLSNGSAPQKKRAEGTPVIQNSSSVAPQVS